MNEQPKDGAIRVKAETRDEINRIAEELKVSANDVLDRLLLLQREKKDAEAGRGIPNLDVFRNHLARVESIYTESVMSAWDKEDQYEKDMEQLREEMRDLLVRENELVKQLAAVDTEKKAEIQVIQDEMEKVRGEAALSRENAAREVEGMRGLLKKAEESREQSAQLVELAQEAAVREKARADEFEAKANQTEEYYEEARKQRREAELLSREIERLTERADIEKQQAVIDVERKFMEQIGKLREDLASSREELSRLREQNTEMKYRLAELERNAGGIVSETGDPSEP